MSSAFARWGTPRRCHRAQVEDLVAIREQHEGASYESELIVGADDCRTYLEFSWPDFQAPVAALLHERRGGWADPMQTVRHLAGRARERGGDRGGGGGDRVRRGDGGVEAIHTSTADRVLRDARGAPGPWVERIWRLLGAPARGRGARRRAAASGRLLEGPGGGVPAAGGRARGPRRGRAPGPPPRPGGRASLRSRRPRDPLGPVGHLPADGPAPVPGLPEAASRNGSPIRTSTPTAPRTLNTRRGRSSRSSSSQGSPRPSAVSAARRRSGERRSAAGSSPTPPTTIRSATGFSRTCTRSWTPGTDSRCWPSGASPPTTCSTEVSAWARSAWAGSSAARPTSPPRAPTRGRSGVGHAWPAIDTLASRAIAKAPLCMESACRDEDR